MAMKMKMAAMKAMKMASMKMKKMAMAKKMGMRKMAMKKSKIAKGKRAKSSVWKGTKVKTSGGLTKGDLKVNKRGKVVSKKASDRAKKGKGYKKIIAWSTALKKARKELKIKGFKACKKGSALYNLTKKYAK